MGAMTVDRTPWFASPAEVKDRLAGVGYLADDPLAVTIYLADRDPLESEWTTHESTILALQVSRLLPPS